MTLMLRSFIVRCFSTRYSATKQGLWPVNTNTSQNNWYRCQCAAAMEQLALPSAVLCGMQLYWPAVRRKEQGTAAPESEERHFEITSL